MEHHETTIIAGERLHDLEHALAHLTFVTDQCGCLGLIGDIPEHLALCLSRALKSIEAELDEQGLCLCVGEEWRPLRQLLIRMGRPYTGDE